MAGDQNNLGLHTQNSCLTPFPNKEKNKIWDVAHQTDFDSPLQPL